jgi:hypothetical protein
MDKEIKEIPTFRRYEQCIKKTKSERPRFYL